jgi:glycerol-3-phosphate dehydrogenase
VINCAGPWVDRALAELGVTTQRQIGGTKGTHIIVRSFPGAPQRALYIAAPDDSRQFFIVPWQGLYLIGTTDSRYDGDLDAVQASQDEVDYLLRSTNATIPSADLGVDDVLYTYSGVRPLPYVREGVAGGITRRHVLYDHARHDGLRGLLSVIGGKITTYRSLAEDTVDHVCKELGVHARSRTATTPLPGAAWGDPETILRTQGPHLHQRYGLDATLVDHLARLYGAQLAALLGTSGTQAELRQRLAPDVPLIAAQALYALEHEQAHSLTDALFRRTMTSYQPERGLDVIEALAELVGTCLGWSAERRQREVAHYRTTMARLLPRPDDLTASSEAVAVGAVADEHNA